MKTLRTMGLLAALAMLGSSSALASTKVVTFLTNLFEPYGVAVERAGDGPTYVTDSANHRIIKYTVGTTSAVVLAGETMVAGTNDGPAAHFNQPQGIVIARGGVVVADSSNHTLRFIDTNGVVTTLAGAPGAFGFVNGPASTARFRFPAGLAVHPTSGEIYIADAQNNAIRKLGNDNVVTNVLTTGLYQPNGIAFGPNGDLWIADTRHHCIKRMDTNGVVTVVAGVYNVSGSMDSTTATNALFTSPRSLTWRADGSELLVSDSGNHAIRRVYFNSTYGTYSVSTFAGTLGTSGYTNGTSLATAQFNTPIGIAEDTLAGGFLIADKMNGLLRFIDLGTALPPVNTPVIGLVDLVLDTMGALVTKMYPATNYVTVLYSTNLPIAVFGEFGTIYYTLDGSDPLPGNTNTYQYTINYRDGQFTKPKSIVDPPKTNFTLRVIGAQTGRRSSQIATAAFEYRVASPSINGDNAAAFDVTSTTEKADLVYTTDGSEPTRTSTPVLASGRVSLTLDGADVIFKAKGFRDNFNASDTITKVFRWQDFLPNEISLGFTNGEASSDYIAAAGQRFFVPVTMRPIGGQKIYSMQFDVFVTNMTAGYPVDGSAVGFKTMLMKPVDSATARTNNIFILQDNLQSYFLPIRTAMAMYDQDTVLRSLQITNSAINMLSVGWLERYGYTNLYDTRVQDLIAYSQPHDTTFRSANGKVVLGAYSFLVPSNAPPGAAFNVRLDHVSATEDGVSRNVYIRVPTNGSLTTGIANGVKQVTVGQRRYVVGDIAPFRWFNAGDFGDSKLLNNDVMQVFQAAIYALDLPPAGSDMMDALDASNGRTNFFFWADGNNSDINQVQFGDGELNIDDVYVVYRRSLDPTLTWYARYWSNNVRQVVEVPNALNGTNAPAPSPAPAAPSKAIASSTATPYVSVTVDDVLGTAGTSAQAGIRLHVNGSRGVKYLMMNVTVEALDGAPEITGQVTLGTSALGSPTISQSMGANNVSAAWLGSSTTLTGDALLVPITIPIPASAGPGAAYRVRFDHFSASPNGVALFECSTYSGMITLGARNSSTMGDSIPDLWRLRWFGSAYNALSAANQDPDNDGRNNYEEYLAGTDPLRGASRLTLSTVVTPGGMKISYPTGLGRTYVLECAAELSGPWSPLATNNGTGTWRDWVDSSVKGTRFYRVRAQ